MLQSSSFKTRKCISNKHINWVQFDVDQTLFNWTKGSPNYKKNNIAISFIEGYAFSKFLCHSVTPVLVKIMLSPMNNNITWYIQLYTKSRNIVYSVRRHWLIIVSRMLV